MEQKKIVFESPEMIGKVFGAYDSNIKIIENTVAATPILKSGIYTATI